MLKKECKPRSKWVLEERRIFTHKFIKKTKVGTDKLENYQRLVEEDTCFELLHLNSP